MCVFLMGQSHTVNGGSQNADGGTETVASTARGITHFSFKQALNRIQLILLYIGE